MEKERKKREIELYELSLLPVEEVKVELVPKVIVETHEIGC